jgi:metal-responsive CopG/Arc/MetJ family transcriptional regulator
MKLKEQTKTIRRSIALSRQLIEEVETIAPPELKGNFNRLMAVALKEFIIHRKEKTFEEAMAQMAADPAIRSENRAISKEFANTETDGLKND